MPSHTTLRARGFWPAYVVQMRPYLLFVSGAVGWCGLSLNPAPGAFRSLAILAASFLGYGFGQALTDCFQQDTDRLSSPFRPLSAGLIGTRDVLLVSLAGLSACTAVFALANPRSLIAGAAAVLGLAAYSTCKRTWWAGPPCNATVVVLLFVMGALSGSPGLTAASLAQRPGFLPIAGTVLFGYLHFVVAGYFKDIEADRATGYHTLPVRFGRRMAAWVSDLLAVGTVVSAAAGLVAIRGLPDHRMAAVLPWALLAASAAAFARSGYVLHLVRSDEEAWRAVVPGLHAYLVALYAPIAAGHPAWVPGLVVFHALFHRSLGRRPDRRQV